MKKVFVVISLIVAFCIFTSPAFSAEATFSPSTQWYNVDSNGVLNLWGVPEANGNPLVANPDYGWPSEFTVACWYAVIMKAHEMSLSVVIGYDPATYDIWYVSKPQ